MLDIEIDGKQVQVPDGSTVMEAAEKAGTYIPHFCYHKKLSIAASCRMCLVQVEKAPKPLPACATPVTNNMKVMTHSEQAVKAQSGVMEFLLINHPLDCPICDQGGECQLQDLAVGYGATESRYQEEKRVVSNKDLGPLVSTDMTRCIHCTRCVRFTQEIAGLMEMGQAYRGEHAEIMPFVEQTITSELSGNIIDLCPVGALTSKPFRFSARTWELSRRKSVAPHDGFGSNLIVQTKHDQIKRVLPLENEEVNECWLSDRDRFSYEALNSDERLTQPMIKQDGRWIEVDWKVVLEYAANALVGVKAEHGASAIAGLLSPQSTVEELFLAKQLMDGLGTKAYDTRLKATASQAFVTTPWLGLSLAQVNELDSVLVVGSNLRKEQPLFAQKLRQLAKKKLSVNLLSSLKTDELIKVKNRQVVAPSQLAAALAGVLVAVLSSQGKDIPAFAQGIQPSQEQQAIAQSLMAGKAAVVLGNAAVFSGVATEVQQVAAALANALSATLGVLSDAANTVGADVVGANATAVPESLFDGSKKAYFVLNNEPHLDSAFGAKAVSALAKADTVVMLSSFKAGLDYADVLLPIAPFSETAGTFVNMEGRVQSFNPVCKPQGNTKPAWKVLQALLLTTGVQNGDAYASTEQIKAAALSGANQFVALAPVQVAPAEFVALPVSQGVERIAEWPLYAVDPIVRRAPALQATIDAQAPVAGVSASLFAKLGAKEGSSVRVTVAGVAIELPIALDPAVPENCVRLAAGCSATAALGALDNQIVVELV